VPADRRPGSERRSYRMRGSIIRRPAFRWAMVVVWLAVIFFGSAQSKLPEFTPRLPGLEENGGHLSEYAVLAVLLWWALSSVRIAGAMPWALGLAVLYAASDEFHQGFVPGRHRDIKDWAVDAFGAALALLIITWLRRRRSRQPEPGTHP
jgi:VanZ family protein